MQLPKRIGYKKAAIVTGEYATPYLKEAADAIMNRLPNTELETLCISNDFFGDSVKVAGLVVGKDIITQLKNKITCKNVLIPDNMLKRDEKVFLDDLTVKDIEEALGIKITICKQDGSDLVKNILEKC